MKTAFLALAVALSASCCLAGDFRIDYLTQLCSEGNLKRTEAIVRSGVDVTATDRSGWLPLSIAAAHGQVEIIKYLLKEGADVNERTSKQNTPMIFAASRGHQAAVELLLQKGADPKLANRDGKTASAAAKAAGYPEIAQLIDGFRAK